MKLYRLHTEKKNKKWIEQLISSSFSGFSIIEQTGYRQGKKERSLRIEIIDNSNSAELKINHICRAICGYNKQDCVLVQEVDCKTQLISSSGVI